MHILWQLNKVGRRPKDYPPGPPTLPIIGNLHQIPRERRYVQFEKWAREYGPIYSLMLGTKVMIVLNLDLAIKDLVDKRGTIYSSRPDAYIAQDISSGGLRVLFMPNSPNNAWKMVRRFLHQILNVFAARTYIPYQDLESKAMFLGVLENPNDFVDHLRRYNYGVAHDPTDLCLCLDYEENILTLVGGQGSVLQAYMTQDSNKHLTSELIASRVKDTDTFVPIDSRNVGPSPSLRSTLKEVCTVDLIQMQKRERFSDDLATYISGSVLQAGSETTASILVGFVRAMIIFPEVAKAAQAEIDRICGDHFPDLDDVPHLPSAVTLRIPRPVELTREARAVHNDPTRHPDRRRFEPLRYIDDHQTSVDAANNPDATKRDHFVFGAGRRRCQGMHIADRSIFLAISRLLWAFDFKRAVDSQTNEEKIPDMDDLADRIMSLPNPFPADIVPRNSYKAPKQAGPRSDQIAGRKKASVADSVLATALYGGILNNALLSTAQSGLVAGAPCPDRIMSLALRALRGRTLTSRPTHLVFRPEPFRLASWRYASSTAALDASTNASAGQPSFLRRAATVFALGIVFTSFSFAMAVSPAVPTVTALMNPPTDEESLEMYKPQTEEERAVDDFIKNHPLAQDLRNREGFSEARPHMKIPEGYRTHHLTGGALSGPGRIVVPPVVFAEEGGKSLIAISYLGNELCGHPGIVHGGLLATMLDEGLARCCFAALPHKMGMTANLNINYRAPAQADSYVVLRATTTKVEGRKAWVEGRIETLVGEGETPVVLAEATALFVSPKQAAVMTNIFPTN
ncbi:hypothetical protein CHU98_g182 [Xylaria longipes]|nr:hypothetical protein CHU98_g182 [Xylaria longipes]